MPAKKHIAKMDPSEELAIRFLLAEDVVEHEGRAKQAADKYEGIDFKPPESVANAAAKGLEYRQKASPSNRGGLTTEEAGKQGIGSGVQRASDLKNRKTVSPETISKMVAFFARHEKNKGVAAEHKGEPWNDKGHVAWLLWGGDAGKTWAEKVKAQMDRADEKSKEANYSMAPRFSMTPGYPVNNWRTLVDMAEAALVNPNGRIFRQHLYHLTGKNNLRRLSEDELFEVAEWIRERYRRGDRPMLQASIQDYMFEASDLEGTRKQASSKRLDGFYLEYFNPMSREYNYVNKFDPATGSRKPLSKQEVDRVLAHWKRTRERTGESWKWTLEEVRKGRVVKKESGGGSDSRFQRSYDGPGTYDLESDSYYRRRRGSGVPKTANGEAPDRFKEWWEFLDPRSRQWVLESLRIRKDRGWNAREWELLIDYYVRNHEGGRGYTRSRHFASPKTAKSNAKVVEVPNTFHPVKLEPPKAKRKEYPFEGYIDFQGIKIDVENAKGSTRSGTGPEGDWSTYMHAHYGEIRGTEGVDGDKLDVYVGDNHDSSLVVVIHQHNPWDGKYDEDKVVIGCESVEEAIGLYKKQYDRPGFFKEKEYTAMPIGAFWRWVSDTRNKGKRVKAASLRTAQLVWKRVPTLNEATLALARRVVWHFTARDGRDVVMVAGRTPRGWNTQYVKDKKDFDHRKMRSYAVPDKQLLQRFKVNKGRRVEILVDSEAPATPTPTGLPESALESTLIHFANGVKKNRGGRSKKIDPKTIEVRWTESGLRSRVVLRVEQSGGEILFPVQLIVEVDGKPWTKDLGQVRLRDGSGKTYADRAYGAASVVGRLIEQQMKRVSRPTPKKLSLSPSDVTSFLQRLSTPTGGRMSRVRYDGEGSAPDWSCTPDYRQRLDHYVGAFDSRDPDDDMYDDEGWDEDSWNEDYAYPLEKEVSDALSKKFGKGLFSVEVGTKGFVYVNPTTKGLLAMGFKGKRAALEDACWDGYEAVGMKEQGGKQVPNCVPKTAYAGGSPAEQQSAQQALSSLLAVLRAASWNYQTSHWQVGGDSSYGDHLLFQRLYEGMSEEIDTLAEKMVGLFGITPVMAVEQAELLSHTLRQWSIGCPFERGILVEKTIQVALKSVREGLDSMGQLTLGMDDFLASASSTHDTHVYLLQQRQGGVKVARAVEGARKGREAQVRLMFAEAANNPTFIMAPMNSIQTLDLFSDFAEEVESALSN